MSIPSDERGGGSGGQYSHRVLVVRHGETAWSREGRHTGVSDVPLDDAGRAGAARLAGVVSLWSGAVVLCSPRARARETAVLAGCDPSRMIIDEDLGEWDYGNYEGLTTEAIRETRPGWLLWRDGVTGGESLDQVSARADHAIGRVRELAGDAVLVAHGHFLRVLAARWIGLDPHCGALLALDAGGYGVLGYEHETPVITRWNLTPSGDRI